MQTLTEYISDFQKIRFRQRVARDLGPRTLETKMVDIAHQISSQSKKSFSEAQKCYETIYGVDEFQDG